MENTQSQSSTLPGKRSTNDDGGGDNSDDGGDGDDDDYDGDDDDGDARSKHFRNARTPIRSPVLSISGTLIHQSVRAFYAFPERSYTNKIARSKDFRNARTPIRSRVLSISGTLIHQ